MSRNNPLRNSTRKNTNYKLYKAKKQWVTACATFLLTFGATAVVTTANAQADTNNNDNQPQVTGVESTTTGTNSQESTSLASGKNEEEQGSSTATDTTTSSSDVENASTATGENASSDSSATKTTGELTSNDKTANSTTTQASTVKDANNNKEETPVQNNTSSDSSVAKTNDESASNDSTAKSTAAQASVAKDADTDNGAVNADSESKSSETTTVDLTKLNGDALGPTALKDSKVKTTDSTVDWSQNRYIYNWDQQGHTADWWKNLIDQKFLPWILKQSDNEGATLESVSWTSGMTTNSDGTLEPTMVEGPADNRFGYPHATVVVKNANGTETTYTDVTINMAKSVASYIRAKWGYFK